ncbi:hypothetical protein ACH5RR_003998 [Cinchona calisaya]|uniref:Uncharacterized protein n=1 Tax=Cinchona calisaya TaxID=153742 RepID=A0ABD3AWB3_9GENT
MQQEKYLSPIKEQWKSSAPASKRKGRPQTEYEEVGHDERRRRKGIKRRNWEKSSHGSEEMLADVDDDDFFINNRDPHHQVDQTENDPKDILAAAGPEDSDAVDGYPSLPD